MNPAKSDIRTLVETTLEAQFERQGLAAPEFSRFDVKTGPDGTTVVVDIASAQPVGVIRDARAATAQALANQGFDVQLIVTASHPSVDYLAAYEPARLRDYLSVAGLALGSLLLLITAMLMFRQLWRGTRRRRSIVIAAPQSAYLAAVEPTYAPAPEVELPPLPMHAPEVQPAPIDDILRDESAADAIVAASAQPDVTALAKASKQTVRQAFSQLSLDAALAMLASVDPATSRTIIEKLQLHRSVKERLEEGVAALRQKEL
jgi:hypothetical protein